MCLFCTSCTILIIIIIIFIVRSTNVLLTMQNDHFFRAANGIFAEVGRLAPEEVILELLKRKCYTCSTVWARGLCIG